MVPNVGSRISPRSYLKSLHVHSGEVGRIMSWQKDRAEQVRTYYLAERSKSDNEPYLSRLLAPLGISENSTFLDIGCGTGYVNNYLSVRKPLHCNLGFDFDIEAIRLARALETNRGRTLWFCASAEAIPLADSSVDHVLCRGVVPLTSVNRVVSEIGRTIRPSGTAAILLHSWKFYLDWLSLRPNDWKRTVAGILILISSLWFNVTGQQIRFGWGRHRITQTFQTEDRIRRVLEKFGLSIYHIARQPEFIVYVKATR
jgi:SAM-dependent methyltransferase